MSLLIKAVPGVTEFLKLTDTPASFSGQAGRVAAVNALEGALEFIDPPEHTTSSITCVEPQLFRPTTSNTWEDFDLKKIVPEGATGAVFHLINTDTGQESNMGLRKKGSTQDYHGSLKRGSHTWAMVGLDEDRVCQGYCERLGYSDFLLVGYTGENFTFFTNGYNIAPVTKGAWVTTDLASYCPNAIGVILEFANHPGDTDIVGARMTGSTDTRNKSAHHIWMVVGCDASQRIDIYDEDWPYTLDSLNLIGYITAGVDFYANGKDLTPAADAEYHLIGLSGYKPDPVFAFIEVVSTSTTEDYAIRKNRRTADIYYDVTNHNFAIVHPNTPNGNIEIKISHVAIETFLLGLA